MDPDAETVEPPSIKCGTVPFDINFHPSQDVIAVGMISGAVKIYKYAQAGNTLLHDAPSHELACRSIQFNADGTLLYTAGADRVLQSCDLAGKSAWKQNGAHDAGINTIMAVDGTSLFSGDDEGVVKIWDTRTNKPVFTFTDNEDVITDFAINDKRDTALATSGDGTMSVFNLKKGKLIARSDQIEDELLSVAIIKHGKKVVTGTQAGVINIFTWGHWMDLDDRALGHPLSVDTILPVDENVLLTGSFDGLIRVLEVQPTKLHGVVGEHGEFPIERIQYSRDKKFLASCSHDKLVKFWDIAFLFEEDDDEAGGDDGDDVGMADDDDAGAGAGAGAGSGAGAGGAAAAGAGAGAGAAAPRKSLKQPGNAESFFDDL